MPDIWSFPNPSSPLLPMVLMLRSGGGERNRGIIQNIRSLAGQTLTRGEGLAHETSTPASHTQITDAPKRPCENSHESVERTCFCWWLCKPTESCHFPWRLTNPRSFNALFRGIQSRTLMREHLPHTQGEKSV